MNPHIYTPFEEALDRLRDDVLNMASLTLRCLATAKKGLFERDAAACGVAIADDAEVDTLEIQIDRDGLNILLKYQPVARDMRLVLAVMKMSSNLERAADQATAIARRARKLNQHPPLPELEKIRSYYDEAETMLADSIRAFTENNTDLARGMKDRDRKLDETNRGLTNFFASCMEKDTSQLRGFLNLIFICRSLERIGDHATNICEDVVFACDAEEIRHLTNPPSQSA